ncbi:MAG TPA: hypothetical protein VMU16_08925 [Candidatus Binataceae bacterium]|nr:hypothetical protein [Candidatus Binataceae bacterium]
MTKFASGREAVWAALGSLGFAIIFGQPILRHLADGNAPTFPWPNDWDFNLRLLWTPYYTIAHFHQFPHWDPYCGLPMLGNPQSAFLTPLLIPTLLFGPVIGLRLGVIAHIAIGFGGAYLLARVLGISKLGAIACAGAFSGSSWFYLRIEAGQTVFLPFAYAPWAMAMLCMAIDRRHTGYAAIAGFALALMVGEGGIYAAPQTAAMLALFALTLAISRRSIIPLLMAVITGGFAFGIAAIKILPSNALVGSLAYKSPSGEFLSFGEIAAALLLTGFYKTESAAHIGVIFGIFALLGLIFQFRRTVPFAILSVALLAMAFGDFGAYSPWAVIHRLPIFAAMRLPSRWLIPFTLIAGVIAGFGVDALRNIARPWGTGIATSLIGLALIVSWSGDVSALQHVVEGSEVPIPWSASFRRMSNSNYRDRMLMAEQANLGVVSCYDVIAPPAENMRASDGPGYRGEQFLLGPGTITLDQWSPNRLDFTVDAPSPATMVINENFAPGWSIAQGQGEVKSQDGLLAVSIPAGRQAMQLIYRSPKFGLGALITLASIGAMILLFDRRLAGKRRPSGDIGLPVG